MAEKITDYVDNPAVIAAGKAAYEMYTEIDSRGNHLGDWEALHIEAQLAWCSVANAAMAAYSAKSVE